jgi:hypothetical protein
MPAVEHRRVDLFAIVAGYETERVGPPEIGAPELPLDRDINTFRITEFSGEIRVSGVQFIPVECDKLRERYSPRYSDPGF